MIKWLKQVGNGMFERLKQVRDGFLSKTGEKIADIMVDTGGSIIGFKRKLQLLESNSITLNCAASDVETEVGREELRGNKRRKTEVKKWLEMEVEFQGDFRSLKDEIREKGIMSRFICVDQVEKLNVRVEKLIEQRQHFGELVLHVHRARGEPLLTEQASGEAFGRNLEQICDCLGNGNGQIVGIHGKAGVGKTELAKHIYNHFLQEAQYSVYWVVVSKNISIKELQDRISHAIGLTLSDENDGDTRAAGLNRALRQEEKFLLILDNLSEDISLKRVGYPLGVDGCQLIITTRSLKVCHRIGCQPSFKVETLDVGKDEDWTLFRETFGEVTAFGPEVEKIAKSVVKRYGGLPKGITDMARRMRGVTEITEWRNELEKVDEFLKGSSDDSSGLESI